MENTGGCNPVFLPYTLLRIVSLSAIFITLLSILSCCEFIGGIFKTGMGVGVIIAIKAVLIEIFNISKLKGNK